MPEECDYIRTRSSRRVHDRDVEPEWATEAATDEMSLISWAPPPRGSTAIESESLLVLGYSRSAAAVLKVWLRPLRIGHGEWVGVNAAFAKAALQRKFLEERSR